jgi:hypothetical protein
MFDTVFTIVLFVVGAYAAARVSRAFDRSFEQLGEYSAGPRPYPDRDPD